MVRSLRNVLVVFGTRPEAIKLAPVVTALQEDGRFNVTVCSSGQHRDMVRPVCDLFGITIDHDLDVMQPGQTIDYITAAILQKLPAVFEATQPEIVIVQGDTTTAFAAALSAFYRNIKIAHVEAGLRTNNLQSPWPEEGNRALISRIAEYHFAPTRASYDNLLAESARGQLLVTGNTVVDAAASASHRIAGVREKEIGLRLGITGFDRNRILFTMHRRESFGEPVERVFRALLSIAQSHDVEILFPVHPNPNITEPARRLLGTQPNIRLLTPLEYDELIFALKHARLLITDSGGLAEEAPTFNTPTLILRENTERAESVDTGGAVLVGYDTARLEALTAELLSDGDLYRTMSAAPNPFGDGLASRRIAACLSGSPADIAEAA
jgi:UDP-N-acetylglucosamine 2-epimerase